MKIRSTSKRVVLACLLFSFLVGCNAEEISSHLRWRRLKDDEALCDSSHSSLAEDLQATRAAVLELEETRQKAQLRFKRARKVYSRDSNDAHRQAMREAASTLATVTVDLLEALQLHLKLHLRSVVRAKAQLRGVLDELNRSDQHLRQAEWDGADSHTLQARQAEASTLLRIVDQLEARKADSSALPRTRGILIEHLDVLHASADFREEADRRRHDQIHTFRSRLAALENTERTLLAKRDSLRQREQAQRDWVRAISEAKARELMHAKL